MSNTEFISFENYLIRKGVEINRDRDIEMKRLSKYTLADAFDYIELLGEFHEASKGYDVYFIDKLENNIGKNIGTYKIQLKRLKKHINDIKLNEPKDIFEEELVDKSEEIIELVNEVIEYTLNDEYLNLIRRSMENIEVCVGSTGAYTLYKEDRMGITDISKCNYDMVEIDCIKLINKLKRNGNQIDFRRIIEYFCEIEGLGVHSKEFIKKIIMYPNETMKCYEKYRANKREFSPLEYKKALKRSIKKDFSLINDLRC